MLDSVPSAMKAKLPFLIAGFASFVLSVFLYFGLDEKTAGIFVGLWVPSIHSLGTLLLTPVAGEARPRRQREREEVRS